MRRCDGFIGLRVDIRTRMGAVSHAESAPLISSRDTSRLGECSGMSLGNGDDLAVFVSVELSSYLAQEV
jgi:hypothetical protein